MLCPHENTAAHMAMGYAAVTGRGQAVLVHVDVGTANTANAMHNLFRSRLPVLLMSGKAPYTSSNELVGSRDTYVHFVQEPIDQGALVRPYMKWEWTLPSGVVVKEALRRAHTIMETKPAGPGLFHGAARDADAEVGERPDPQLRGRTSSRSRSPAAPIPRLIAQLADKLIAAEHPILICGYAGQSKNAPKLIEELAMFAGIAVFEGNQTFNISHEFPCFLGYSPNKHLPKADVGLLVDVDVPWFPADVYAQGQVVLGAYRRRHAEVRVADVDLPGQPADAGRLRRHPRAAAGRAEEEGDAEVQGGGGEARRGAHRRAQGLARERGQDGGQQGQARRDQPALPVRRAEQAAQGRRHRLQRRRPQRRRLPAAARRGRCRTPACAPAAAGSAGPAAWRSAPSSRRPTRWWSRWSATAASTSAARRSVFSVAQQYKLPILVLLLDNTGWSAVKESTLRVFPEGEAKSVGMFQASLMPDAEFSKIGEAFGAYGEKVTNPDDVPAALARA